MNEENAGVIERAGIVNDLTILFYQHFSKFIVPGFEQQYISGSGLLVAAHPTIADYDLLNPFPVGEAVKAGYTADHQSDTDYGDPAPRWI